MKTLILFLFISAISFSQQFRPKQITFFDFDCKNPAFIIYPLNVPDWNNNQSEIIFEVHTGNSINIYALNYNAVEDTFYEAVPVTNDNFINRNPTGYFYFEETESVKIIVWETNKNGNWDLEYSTNSGNGWSEPEILFFSEANETHPVFIKDSNWPDSNFKLLFEKEGSICLYTKTPDSINISVVFQTDGNIKYSNATGINSWNGLYIAAIADDGVKPKLIYTENYIPNQVEPPIQNLYTLYPVRNSKFVDLFFDPVCINFEIEINGRYKSVLLEEYNFGLNTGEIYVDDDTTIESTNFNGYIFQIITEAPTILEIPAVYRILRNDSTYIISNEGLYSFYYQEIYTKFKNSYCNIGPLVLDQNYFVISYSVWEDSTGSNINLFGLKRLDPIGDVKESKINNNFSLFQNYPNPFNPSTKIKYTIPQDARGETQEVVLKVYDVLGREVAALVNEEKQQGEYEVEFDASQLSSGIYFYKLQTESFSSTKKMIYLK